jgi:chemotaxis protein MotB
MARRIKRYEHDNRDRWLISYADFVTLLFAFFVVMYSISSVNEEKYKSFGEALNTAFNKEAEPQVGSGEQGVLFMADRETLRLAEQQRKRQEQMKNLSVGLSQVMSDLIEQNQVSVRQTKRGVEIDISASTLFGTGEASLQPGALAVLRQVAGVLGREEFSIEVEGHTDNIPIATAQFPSNWELSAARASSVARLLGDGGVPARRLAVIGRASNQPQAANDTAEGRAKNRRVTIIVVSPGAGSDAEKPVNPSR